ncbi:MAG: aminotransferase class V-fold PLP-dependent enzyme [Methanobacteriota archaeon]|nr:MAG: aminotransferase class V-fold PLP-dependent enzyme [Euryarchaeota archaeon]
MIDVDRVRKDTPGCFQRVHFNNAGASLPPQAVLETVLGYLEEESRVGGYELAAARAEEIAKVYGSIASLIGGKAEEISRAENATRAWEMAFYGIDFKKGDRILTTFTEYCSNYVSYLHLAKTKGIEIHVVEDDGEGALDLTSLERELERGAKLVSINHIPTNSGLVNPAEEVGKLAEEYGTLYLLDACQSVGQKPIDVHRLRCDFLSATGRKFLRGPRGTGFLYVREERLGELHPPIIDAFAASYTTNDYEPHLDRRRFETFEFNPGLFLGLGRAVEYAMEIGVEKGWKRIQMLASHLRESLDQLEGVNVRDLGKIRGGIVTFEVKGQDHFELRDRLIENGFNVSVTQESNAYLDMKRRGLESLVRASVHYYNTIEEIERFCEAVHSLI